MDTKKGCPPKPQATKGLPAKKSEDGDASGGGPVLRLRKPKSIERGGIFACAQKKKGFDREF